jgi:CheY-like chemotaxis protein
MARILVVDDEPDERFLVGRILRRAGHEVTVAGDGAAALLVVNEWSPDLIVTDMMMPVMDGVELIRRLRADPATAAIPVVAATGDAHLARAADAVLAKPYDWRHLVKIANTLLAEGRAGVETHDN